MISQCVLVRKALQEGWNGRLRWRWIRREILVFIITRRMLTSLYEDHCCGKENFPTETVQILTDHTNEVWFVQFSNNGEYLASSSSDCMAIIWKVPEQGSLALTHKLCGHQKPVSFLSWSPDGTVLITCGCNEVLSLWNVNTGTGLRTFNHQCPVLSSCAWLPESEGFFFGCSEPNRCNFMFKFHDFNNLIQLTGDNNPIESDVDIVSNGKNTFCLFASREVVIRVVVMNTEWKILESLITSVCVSQDGDYVMVNLSNQEIHVWDVARNLEKPLKYGGHKQERFVIHSCFGGLDSMFIASGSEDSQVYIWNRNKSKPIQILSGHSMVVKCVSWNPKKHQMLASASDDKTIRIWGPCRMKKNEQKQERS